MASINEFEELLFEKLTKELKRDDVELGDVMDMAKWVNELKKTKVQEETKLKELELQEKKDKKLSEIEREKFEYAKEKDQKLLEVENKKLEQSKERDNSNVEIERERMTNQFDLQQDKQRHDDEIESRKEDGFWKKAAVDLGLSLIPMMLSILAYKHQQNKVMLYEENGRINSTAARKFLNELKWPFGKK